MAVTRKEFLYGTFLLAITSIVLLSIGVSTQSWVDGTAVIDDSISANIDTITFGLFQGTHVIKGLIGEITETMRLTCLLGDNICAFSCRQSRDFREQEIKLYFGGKVLNPNCGNTWTESEKKVEITWFNGGVFISALVFLGMAGVFSLMTAILGLYNSQRTPIEPLLSIFGLYIWHGVSAGCVLIAIIMYGVHFETNVKENFSYTMFFSKDYRVLTVHIGYSYWLVFASILCHLIAEGLLIWRWWLIKTEPPPPTIEIEKTEDTIFLY